MIEARLDMGEAVKVHIEQAPHLIQFFFDMVEKYRAEYEDWMEKADREPDPELRKMFERSAASAMDVSNGMHSDAESLLEQFEAAGGSWERLQ